MQKNALNDNMKKRIVISSLNNKINYILLKHITINRNSRETVIFQVVS